MTWQDMFQELYSLQLYSKNVRMRATLGSGRANRLSMSPAGHMSGT